MDVELIETKEVYRGFFRLFKVLLRYRRFDGRMSGPVTLEALERGEGVAVILYDPERDCVGLVRQFRIGAHLRENRGWVLELAAGSCQGQADVQAVALKEVREETGWTPSVLEHVNTFYISPSGTTERIHLFLGIFDSRIPPSASGVLEEEEDIQTVTIPFPQVLEMMAQGEINAASVILGMQWLQINRPRLQARFMTQPPS
ncbi:MAG: NUDIX domain-containing protein [Magnetococcales bacterium]|nr:NUDIX domain-containing protein [Magnetococcales bacterium]MBF0149280.1 NUDIX domain-containing protein [Magnetococcales bacterium]MBF0172813.1 NUDIX domain-containing protein [Magnetococcales bacterium]MBF0631612.1 NUDIX domain-containing protein [Magnetococcales bacterium]